MREGSPSYRSRSRYCWGSCYRYLCFFELQLRACRLVCGLISLRSWGESLYSSFQAGDHSAMGGVRGAMVYVPSIQIVPYGFIPKEGQVGVGSRV